MLNPDSMAVESKKRNLKLRIKMQSCIWKCAFISELEKEYD